MLRQRPATRFHRGHDLLVRVHVLPRLRGKSLSRCVSELRWRFYRETNAASTFVGEVPRLHEADSQSQVLGNRYVGHDAVNPAPDMEGEHVQLEPLSLKHLDGLCAVGLDPELWRWTPNQVRDRDEMRAYVEAALDDERRNLSQPFATILKETDQVVGCTRYLNMDLKNRRVEIGATWIGKLWQRTAVNTEAKYLMLRHAFEALGCVRVELKTDALNERSRKAILRLGAKEEGILRRHVLTYTGRMRDTVYFSVLDHEWPSVKACLQTKLNSNQIPTGTAA